MDTVMDAAGSYLARQWSTASAAFLPYVSSGMEYVEYGSTIAAVAVASVPPETSGLVATVAAATMGTVIGTMLQGRAPNHPLEAREAPNQVADEEVDEEVDEEADEEDDDEGEVQITIKSVRARKKSREGGLLVAVSGTAGDFKVATVHPNKIQKGKKVHGCIHHVGGTTRGARLTDKRKSSILKVHGDAHAKGVLKNGKCRHHVANWKAFAAKHGGIGGVAGKDAVCLPVLGVPANDDEA